MAKLVNRAKMTTATTGTGTITLGSASSGYQSFADAGVVNSDVVRYVIEDGSAWEIGTGTYTAAGTALSRTVAESSNADAALNLTGSAVVYVSAAAADIPPATLTIANKTAAYTVVADDLGKIINCTANSFTVAFTAAATLGAGFNFTVWNTSSSSSDQITINPAGSETIDGLATLILRRGEGMQIVCDGTNFQTGDKKTMRGYAENFSAGDSRPSASGSSAIAMGVSATASGGQSFAAGGWATASGTASVSIGGYIAAATASATYGTALGSNSTGRGSQAVTGSGAMALGGSYASGVDSFAAATADITTTYGATGANSVAIGQYAKATGTGVAIGNSAQATTNYAYSIGFGTIASGNYSFSAGRDTTASARGTVALGEASLANLQGKMSFAASRFSTQGDAQSGTFVLRSDTTDATAEALTTSNTAAGTTNQIILPNNSAYSFYGTIVARQQASGGTASAAWKIEGLIRREGSAGTTVLVASTTLAISNIPLWSLALSADTTNGGLKVEATGAAATNIRWVATINTSEVTY